ncbi:MAG TPA: hypothetical protein VKA50_01680 [Gammaproteobacteria bacterium]|nr:hypothetical protein [Gammaproteobacteria bacterium]
MRSNVLPAAVAMLACALAGPLTGAQAAEGNRANSVDTNGAQAPWGSAKAPDIHYTPHHVLYDVTSGDEAVVSNILDRASYLSKLYNADPFDSSIVIMIHGDAIKFFAIKNYRHYRRLMQRAHALTIGTTIEFRMCKAAAARQGLHPKDIHGFVAMVPMADAEITRLELEEGYAYMH